MTKDISNKTQKNQHITEGELEDNIAAKAIGGANAADYLTHTAAGVLLGGACGTVIGIAAGKGDKKGSVIGAPVGAAIGGLALAAATKAFR